jgi:hypothetical protein
MRRDVDEAVDVVFCYGFRYPVGAFYMDVMEGKVSEFR